MSEPKDEPPNADERRWNGPEYEAAREAALRAALDALPENLYDLESGQEAAILRAFTAAEKAAGEFSVQVPSIVATALYALGQPGCDIDDCHPYSVAGGTFLSFSNVMYALRLRQDWELIVEDMVVGEPLMVAQAESTSRYLGEQIEKDERR